MFLLCHVNTNVTIGFLAKFHTIFKNAVKATTAHLIVDVDGTKVGANGQSVDEEYSEEISGELIDQDLNELKKRLPNL